ncbi:MAG: MFS transporter, partial [Actinomycetales bacterium]|nr:MFS transporter [Actinomycetales bacterium]
MLSTLPKPDPFPTFQASARDPNHTFSACSQPLTHTTAVRAERYSSGHIHDTIRKSEPSTVYLSTKTAIGDSIVTSTTDQVLPEETTKLPPGAKSVITMSTLAFTLMFAAWMMFGILGIPIREELGLTDVQFAWISAAAILNGSLWRLPSGILADRFGGRIVMLVLLLVTAVFSYLVSLADSYSIILILAFLVGFAGNSFSAGVAWNAAWVPKDRQGLALGIFGAGNVGASVTKFIGPVLITATAGATYFGFIQG